MLTLIFVLIIALVGLESVHAFDSFDDNYSIKWGGDHVIKNRPDQITLLMDQASGCGIWSKEFYGSGFFQMKIRAPKGYTAGVVTTFYLMSIEDEGGHDEIDFEFLGDKDGKLVTLQTNVYANGEGHREQRLRLWFDPTADFHYYSILWNDHQIVFYVDYDAIRVFKNEGIKVKYPRKPMRVEASIWNGESWASHGLPVNWSCAPFDASYQYFHIDGCPARLNDCCSQKYFWNDPDLYWTLSARDRASINNVKTLWMSYDYCRDRKLWPVEPPECKGLNELMAEKKHLS